MRQFATFSLGGLRFGVPVLRVQEVIRYQRMTPVPLAADAIEGVINLRGQIVTAVDLRRRIGLAARPATQLPMNVVVRTDDAAISLLVDEIGDVVEAGDDQFEQAPDNVRAQLGGLVDGVYKLSGQLLLILDVERAIDVDPPRAARPSKA